jgi:hypothetical protein
VLGGAHQHGIALPHSNWPGAGRGGTHCKTGHNKGKLSNFQDSGKGNTQAAAPNSAKTDKPRGGIGRDTLAKGQAAISPSSHAMGCKAHRAAVQAPDQNTPNRASGVTTKVTQGMASRLASNPTSET